jgi:hypothetical protein
VKAFEVSDRERRSRRATRLSPGLHEAGWVSRRPGLVGS